MSFQGEGTHTGKATAWIRFFLCNLQCEGFNQKDPTDPSTYILPYKDFDVSTVSCVEDLPVWDYGCDSSYSFAKKFSHLGHEKTPAEVCNEISSTLKHKSNPLGFFMNPTTKQHNHMAFTGGEPMLNQLAMVDILSQFDIHGNIPQFVTVETNGTKAFKEKDGLAQMIKHHSTKQFNKMEWFWSVSPKLRSTSGELFKKAIKPEIVGTYAELPSSGQLKYVVNGTDQSWEEVEEATYLFRKAGVKWDVFIMAVGATKEQQEGDQIADIAIEAMKRGYHFSPRAHCQVFGNKVGT